MKCKKKSFADNWKEIRPLYIQTEPRLSLQEIGDKLGLSTTQVSRITKNARDKRLVERRPYVSNTPYRGMNYGSLPSAVLPHAAANPDFKDWLTVEVAKCGVTVAELAVSALLDVFYEETSG